MQLSKLKDHDREILRARLYARLALLVITGQIDQQQYKVRIHVLNRLFKCRSKTIEG